MKYFFFIFILISAFYIAPLADASTENYALTAEMLQTSGQTVSLTETEALAWQLTKPQNIPTAPLVLLHQEAEKTEQPFLKTKLDPVRIYDFILAKKFEEGEQTSEDAHLTIKDKRAVEFNPGKSKFFLDIPKTVIAFIKKGQTLPENLEMIGVSSGQKITLEQTNSLGIKELLGRGRSTFKGSSKNRRINIKVALEKMRGIILAPGETFSFNDNLGSVEAKDGFVPEIVIKKNGLFPELGGGVCQVSSTVFRGAYASGLPITERKNHSFAVSHYAPQGSDATTYTGVIDLKFTNNTPAHLLIWPYYENEDTIIFDYYGTRDNRTITLQEPLQYDRKSDGSLKASWDRTVSFGSQIKVDSLKSNYLPPAQFKKVETFVPVAPAPTEPTQTESNVPTPTPQTTNNPTPSDL